MERVNIGKLVNKYFIILLSIFFSVIYTYFIIKSDLQIPMHTDEARHLVAGLKYYYLLTNPSPEIFRELLKASDAYPPLLYFSSAILASFFGVSRTIFVKTNIIYFLIMVFSVYFIGKKIGNRKIGLLSAFILSVFPMIFGMSRSFMLEFSLTAMVSFSICCLFYAEGFTNKKYSLLFGLSLGLGMLAKWTFPIFLIGPFSCLLITMHKKGIKNLLYALMLGLLVASLWYLPYAINTSVIERLAYELNFFWYSLGGFLSYLRSIFYQISPFFLVFLLIILPLIIRKRFTGKSVILSWVLLPYIILTAIDTKWTHYIMPVLPAIALILAIGIYKIPFKKLRHALIFILIFAGIFQLFYITDNGYGKIKKITERLFLNINIMKRSIGVQNMWDYIGDKSIYAERKIYKQTEQMLAEQLLPHFEDISLGREKTVIGIIDPNLFIFHLIEYLILKNNWQNIETVGFCQETHRFLELVDKFDFLIVNYNAKLWPDVYDIEEMFRMEGLDRIRNLNTRDYRTYAKAFERLAERFRVTEIVRLNSSLVRFDNFFAYLYLLAKPDGEKYEFTDWEQEAHSLMSQRDVQVFKESMFSISNGRSSLLFDTRSVRIYHNDIELTASQGISTSFKIGSQTYYSSQALWQIEKINNQKITARLRWPDLALTQIWDMEMDDRGDILWKVEMHAEQAIDIDRLRWRLSLMISGEYKEWISLDEIKKFSETKSWNDTILRDLTKKYIGVRNYKDRINVPGILFVSDADATETIPVIKYSRELRDLRYHGAAKKDNFLLLSNKNYNLFSGKIMLLANENLESYIKRIRKEEQTRKKMQRISSVIKREQLELFLDYGQGRIFYQGEELTKRYGLYTSLFSDNLWHDSQNAIWNIKKIDDHKIIAYGKWIHLPISQVWEMELVDDHTILWKIKMQVYEEVNIESEQAGIMLLPEYSDWLAIGSDKKGKFPYRFSKSGQEWNLLYSGGSKVKKIMAMVVNRPKECKNFFPSVLFNCSFMSENYSISAKNTDEIFKARVLCCYKVNKKEKAELSPGVYEYFTGRIEISPN